MAKEDDLDLDVEAGADKGKSGSKSTIIIIVLVVALLGVSAAATLMLTGVIGGEDTAEAAQAEAGGGKAKDSEKKKANKSKTPNAPLSYVPLAPPFVVNFAGDTDVRFLQISVELGTRDPAMVEKIKEHNPAIRNALVFLFKAQDPVALDTPEGMEKLRQDALAKVQEVLRKETGDAGIESVYFTSFVMQ
ncbi:MAG TPA: flagellar basal body-associated protein FliL [Gammaproteobacteria bacterium]|nr:flagellar basal body-associated protein FliL [Gammaproteobacteria bacterium]